MPSVMRRWCTGRARKASIRRTPSELEANAACSKARALTSPDCLFKMPPKKPEAPGVPRCARQSKAHLDCRATTIKSRVAKILLAFVSPPNNHRLAATAKMAFLFAATHPD